MVHSSMSPHLFVQPPQIPAKTPPASPTKCTPCALPKMEGCNPLIPRPMHTPYKTTRGTPTPPPSHFGIPSQPCPKRTQTPRRSQCRALYGVRRFSAAFDQQHHVSDFHDEQNLDQSQTSYAQTSTFNSHSIQTSRAIILRYLRSTSYSSLTTSNLLRIYQC
jgi:hypothetical protein